MPVGWPLPSGAHGCPLQGCVWWYLLSLVLGQDAQCLLLVTSDNLWCLSVKLKLLISFICRKPKSADPVSIHGLTYPWIGSVMPLRMYPLCVPPLEVENLCSPPLLTEPNRCHKHTSSASVWFRLSSATKYMISGFTERPEVTFLGLTRH